MSICFSDGSLRVRVNCGTVVIWLYKPKVFCFCRQYKNNVIIMAFIILQQSYIIIIILYLFF